MKTRSPNHCCHGKVVSVTHSECISVALVIQHEKAGFYCRLCHIWLYYVFPHYLINGTIFGGGGIEQKMCVLMFYATFV